MLRKDYVWEGILIKRELLLLTDVTYHYYIEEEWAEGT